jgi:hypothetical protein
MIFRAQSRVLATLLVILLPVFARAEPVVVGWIETVRVYPAELLFLAKFDTGARTTSINAQNIEEFAKDGVPWVRFDIVNRNQDRVTLELPRAGEVIIKEHGGRKVQRPVVTLGICVRHIYKETEVSLVDREGFLYPLLIGRKYMKKDFLVDPSSTKDGRPRCPRGADRA